MLTVVRWFLQRLSKQYNRTGRLTQLVLAGIYMGVVASALITEWIGIHLIFGAFLLGVAMPKNAGLTRELAEKNRRLCTNISAANIFCLQRFTDSNRPAQ
jgi:transporter, CPA2 family (2.A.37)